MEKPAFYIFLTYKYFIVAGGTCDSSVTSYAPMHPAASGQGVTVTAPSTLPVPPTNPPAGNGNGKYVKFSSPNTNSTLCFIFQAHRTLALIPEAVQLRFVLWG